MEQTVVYPNRDAFMGRLAIMTIREHLCGYYQLTTRCAESDVRVDGATGHRVCCGCGRVTSQSGLRKCDICDREYIDLTKYQDNEYETNCPDCVVRFGLDDE